MGDITITIKSAGDKKHPVTIDTDATVGELKKVLEAELDVPAERQRLIYSGKVLKDGDTVGSYGIKDGHALHMVKGAAKGGASGASSGGSSGVAGAGSAAAGVGSGSGSASGAAGGTAGSSGVPSNLSAGQSAFDPLAGLTSARYAGYNIPMPSMEQMGFNPDGTPNEEMLEQMMDNPMFQEGMRSMLSDPQMVDRMIEQSPQLRSMGPMAREMLQSDYMRNMLTNPQALRSMMQFQRMMSQAEGGAAVGGFPAPGGASATDSAESATTGAAASDSTGATAGAPGAPGAPGAAPVNPFAALFGNSGAAGPAGTAGAGAAANPFANPALLSMLGSMGAGTGAAAAPQDTRPPEEVFQTQLGQLNDMGFFDFDRNVAALRRSGGSVEGAIEMLLNGTV